MESLTEGMPIELLPDDELLEAPRADPAGDAA